MKKSLVIISFAFIFLLSMSIISANINQNEKSSFGEWLKELWGKITGKATTAKESGGRSVGDAVPITTCTDSDGNNPNVKGSVTASNLVSTDSCMSSSIVKEYTCLSPTASQATATNQLCQSGYSCNDGACKPTRSSSEAVPITTCTDSDGNNSNIQGSVSILNGPTSVDFCMGNAIIEYTCSSPSALQSTGTTSLCQSGYSCQNGACKTTRISIGTGTPVIPPCTPNYVEIDCADEVAVFEDANNCAPDYAVPSDCDGNGVISDPSCLDIDLSADGEGVFIDFSLFDDLENYTDTGNRTISMAKNYQGVEFNWDFANEFNFCEASLETGTNNFGYVLFDYTPGEVKDKIAFVDIINKSNKVCIKDSSVVSISDVSAKCDASGEILIKCPGNFTLTNPTYTYYCTIVSDDDGLYPQYKVWPLKHSAVKEIFVSQNITGQRTGCTESWNCTGWSDAVNLCGTRTCADLRNCGTISNKPLENKVCGLEAGECSPSWSCTDFEKCADGIKSRTCEDLNDCGDETDKPKETSECKKNSVLFIILGIVGLILIILIIWYFMKKRKLKKEEQKPSGNQVTNQTLPPRSPPAQGNVYTPPRTPPPAQRAYPVYPR